MGETAKRNEDRRILIIGGCGYIGSVLVRLLLNRGYRVRVLDDLIYGNGSSIGDLFETEGFTMIRGDLRDGIALEAALDTITDVVLLAALVGDPMCKKYPDEARTTNEDGAKGVFDALHGLGIRNFVFTSTCSNYGLQVNDEPAAEDAELNPQSLYARTKISAEKYILEHAGRVDFCPTILRLATAYGLSHRMRFDLTVSEFTRELALGRELLVYDENTWRPYCHIQDIGSAVVSVLESPADDVAGQVFNVGSNSENYTKKMLVDTICSQVENARVRYAEGGSDPRDYRVSFDKIQSRLGFTTTFTVKDSVAALLEAIDCGLYSDVEGRRVFYGNYAMPGQDGKRTS
jgi:nucleoside-diphosphate-sugar epimerase